MFSIRVILTLLVAIVLSPALLAGGDVHVVEFTSPHCLPCQEMKPIVARLRGEGLTIVTCDIHAFSARAKFYGVGTVPSFVAVRDNQVVKVLHGKVPEQDLRALFQTSACDRAKPGPRILPEPNGKDEDWTPAPQLPPAPQPLPPPDDGPYERKPEAPKRPKGVADVLIFGWPARQTDQSASRDEGRKESATEPASPDPPSKQSAAAATSPTPESSARAAGPNDSAESDRSSGEQASDVTDQAAEPGGSAASDPVPIGSAAGPAGDGPSGTRRFFLFEWLGIGSSAASSGAGDRQSVSSPTGWSKAEVLGWLISVALTAAGFKFGGPLGSWLTKAAIRGVVRLVTKKAAEQAEQRDRGTAPSLNDDYAEQLNSVYSLSGRSPTADATLGRVYERELTEAAQGNGQCASFARAMVRKVHDEFGRIHDTTPMPAEPTAGDNPRGL